MIHQQAEIPWFTTLKQVAHFALPSKSASPRLVTALSKLPAVVLKITMGDDPKDGQNPQIILVQEEIS